MDAAPVVAASWSPTAVPVHGLPVLPAAAVSFPTLPTAIPAPLAAPSTLAPVLAYVAQGYQSPENALPLPEAHAQVDQQLQGMGAVLQTPSPHEFPSPEEFPDPEDYAMARLQHIDSHPEDYDVTVEPTSAPPQPVIMPPHAATPLFIKDSTAQLDVIIAQLTSLSELVVQFSEDLSAIHKSVVPAKAGEDTVAVATSEIPEAPTPAEPLEDRPATWASYLIQSHAILMNDFAAFVERHATRPADFLAGLTTPTQAPAERRTVGMSQVSTAAPVKEQPEQFELPFDPDPATAPPATGAPEKTEAKLNMPDEIPEISAERVTELQGVSEDTPKEELKKRLHNIRRSYKTLVALREKRRAAAEEIQDEPEKTEAQARYELAKTQVGEVAACIQTIRRWAGIAGEGK